MNILRLNITVNSLSFLDATAPNTYVVVLKFFNSSGDPLGNPNVPDTYPATVETTTTTFDVDVPITNGDYVIPNVTVKAFANDVDDCCVAQKIITITNSDGEDPDPDENELLLAGYYAQ